MLWCPAGVHDAQQVQCCCPAEACNVAESLTILVTGPGCHMIEGPSPLSSNVFDGAGLRRYGVINQLVETEYDVERVAEVKRRFLQLKGCMSIEDFFSGWFHGAPAETIKRGNVEDFVAYGFYFRTLEGLPSEVHSYTFRGLASSAVHGDCKKPLKYSIADISGASFTYSGIFMLLLCSQTHLSGSGILPPPQSPHRRRIISHASQNQSRSCDVFKCARSCDGRCRTSWTR